MTQQIMPWLETKQTEILCLQTYVLLHTMHIAGLFITAKTWKQSRCPSASEWISKLLHPYNGMLFSDNLYANLHSSFICNSQKLEITQTSTNRQMDKKTTVVYPYNGIILNNTNEQLIHATRWLNLKIVTVIEKCQSPHSPESIYHMILFI